MSKPTLYAQFGSKEHLIATVLERRSRSRQAGLGAFLDAQGGTPADRLLSVFDWLAQGHQREGFRGCPFTNAAVELPDPGHPARAVIADYKLKLRGLLSGLAAQASLNEPGQVGSELLMLIDGANARVVVTGDRSAMLQAKEAARKVILASAPAGSAGSKGSKR